MMRARLLIASLVVAAAVALLARRSPGAEARWQATASGAGEVTLARGGKQIATIAPGLFEQGWRGASLGAAVPGEAKQGVHAGEIVAPSGGHVSSELRASSAEGGVRLAWTLTPQADLALLSLHVAIELPAELLAGGAYVADNDRGTFPAELKDTVLRSKPTRSLTLITRTGDELTLRFAEGTHVLLQDDRKWGPNFTVRIGPPLDPSTPWPKGRAAEIAFQLSSPKGMDLVEDAPATIEAGPEWIPLDHEQDIVAGSALDLSGAGGTDAPAGKHGWVIATPGGDFAFEDDPKTPRRFWGVNLCFDANYPSHDEADRLAERLARLGYNALRVHHYESGLVDRSKEPAVALKKDSLDLLDSLFAALKKRGIYVTTDLFVSRPIPAAAVWEGEKGDVEMDEYKMLVPVNERAFANWKAFAKELLAHVNPYTGLSYAKDPALAWLAMINEGNFGNYFGRIGERTRRDWATAWARWQAKRHPKDTDAAKAPMPAGLDDPKGGPELAVFFAETEREMFRRMKAFLRDEVGTRALLTDMSSWTNPPANQVARLDYDYVDDHFYVYHPQFLGKRWQLPSRAADPNPVEKGAPGGRSCAFVRVLGKPFAVTEFNYAFPGRCRGMSGLLTGALAALQGWSGVWRFAYAHQQKRLFAPSPLDYFDLASDPLNQAADRAAVCLFLRGDMKAAPHTVAIAMREEDLEKGRSRTASLIPPWTWLAGVTRVGTSMGGKGADVLVPFAEAYAEPAGEAALARLGLQGNQTDLKQHRIESETGEFLVDPAKRVLVIRTPRTAGGYAAEGGTIDAADVSIRMERGDGVVWVTSLDGKAIAESARLLVTHLTDLQDTGTRFGEGAHETLLARGELPHLMRAGRATLTLKLRHAADARVWALATSGRRLDAVKTSVTAGALVVPLSVDGGPAKARMLYEIEAR